MNETLDLIVGADAIAAFTNLKVSQVYHQAAIGALPVTKQGALLVASRSRLAEHFGARVVARETTPPTKTVSEIRP
jgi:hypothetical protein